MCPAEFDQAGAFGVARHIALERDGPQFIGGAMGRTHENSQ